MIRLIRVELSRFRARRSMVVLGLLVVVIAGLTFASTAWDTRPASAAEQASAEAQAASAAYDAQTRASIADCRRDPTVMVGPDATPADCVTFYTPTAENFAPREPLDLAKVLPASGAALATLVAMFMTIAGARFGGADWPTGAISNQLLFEPRRSRLWLAKTVTVTGVSALATLVILGLFWMGWFGVAGQRDIEVTPALASRIGWHIARSVLLGAAAGLLGFALSMLFRSTLRALTLVFGVAIAAELLFSVVALGPQGRWSPSVQVYAWLLGRTSYFDVGAGELGLWPAAAVIFPVVLICCVASRWSFARRDLP